jgi:LysR family transcriptional regulator, transcriptional activator of nhaA
VEWLNYHHLLYFWTVAREGSVTRASELLELTQPTVSTQVASLERALGTPLFRRTGRTVTLTEAGRVVYEYADEIFKLGQELTRVMQEGPTRGRSARIVIGVADVLPKLIVYNLLAPIYELEEPVVLSVIEDKSDRLLAELALHNLDIVLTDSQVTTSAVKVKAYNHPLGESDVSLVATPAIVEKYKGQPPENLQGLPMLVPSEHNSMRKAIDEWFASRSIRPDIRGEFADSALLKVFAAHGVGAIAVPSVVEAEANERYGLRPITRLEGVKERYFAVTVERRLRHPAILKITESAREKFFAPKD